jgi:hypothetical protein
MFGMLDYRAHKLLRLINLPIVLIVRLLFFANVAISVLIAERTQYGLLLKSVVAYISFEVIGLLLFAVVAFLTWLIRRMFFWFIDVVPARGENEEEAKEIVLKGRIIWLTKKLTSDIGNWSWEDTDDFVSQINWRARWLFKFRERFAKRVAILKQHYKETGEQPKDISPDKVRRSSGI